MRHSGYPLRWKNQKDLHNHSPVCWIFLESGSRVSMRYVGCHRPSKRIAHNPSGVSAVCHRIENNPSVLTCTQPRAAKPLRARLFWPAAQATRRLDLIHLQPHVRVSARYFSLSFLYTKYDFYRRILYLIFQFLLSRGAISLPIPAKT